MACNMEEGITGTLGQNDLHVVLSEIIDAKTKAKYLGLALGLSPATVGGICQQYGDLQDRLLYVIEEFLKKIDPHPTWKAIAIAMRSPTVNFPDLAERIEDKYFIPSQQLNDQATAAVPDIFDKVPSMKMFILIKFVNKESYEEEFRTIQKVGPKWRGVATLLGIEIAKIDNIASNPMNTDPEAAASSMLQHWLGVDTNASWKKLCKAMRDANLKVDAKTLEYALAHMITSE